MFGAWRMILLSLLVGIVLGMLTGWKITSWYYKSGEVKAYAEQIDRMREQGKKVSQLNQEQIDELAQINTGLADDLERLRNRPPRIVRTPTACEGSTGAELSGEDAGFLVREAARADGLRAALRACYAYADEVSRGH